MTSKLIVTGGNPLSGTITPVPNKNSIIKCIPAALLTDEPVTLRRVPRTSDVMYMLQIRDQLGGVHKRIADDEIMLDASKVDSYEIDANLSQKMKASVMFS
jgi:UDP-N-acetylglucosamine 1-carboxyvinyltransferase